MFELWAGVKFSFKCYRFILAWLFSADLPRFFDLLPYSLTLTLFANVTDLSGDVILNKELSPLLADCFLAVLRFTGCLWILSADLLTRLKRV